MCNEVYVRGDGDMVKGDAYRSGPIKCLNSKYSVLLTVGTLLFKHI